VRNSGFLAAAMARDRSGRRTFVLEGCTKTADATENLPARYTWKGAAGK